MKGRFATKWLQLSNPSQNQIIFHLKYHAAWSLAVTYMNIQGIKKVQSGNDQEKVQVGKDQEKAQSEKDSHSKNRGGKKPN